MIASFPGSRLGASGRDNMPQLLDGFERRTITTFERLESKPDDKLGPVPLRQKRILTQLIRRH